MAPTPMRFRLTLRLASVALSLAALYAGSLRAAEATIAVATNFAPAAGELATAFSQATPHRVRLSSGSTGKLYAQIVHGAPFDAFLAADTGRPERLEREGRAVAGSRFTYAVGRLVLWSAQSERLSGDPVEALRARGLRRLAMANPDLAPYGAAARETLESLGLLDALRDRLVYGENVGQAYALVVTGNAELGFVALAQLARSDGTGSRWLVPADLHRPIRQDAVLLSRGSGNPAARAFLAFLRGPQASAILEAFGYGSE